MAGLVDLHRARLLDVVTGRAGAAVTGWLAGRDEPWLAAVERVALDPYRGYYNAMVGGLDAPEVVVDAFHIVRLGNTVVDEVRRRTQQATLSHRSRTGDPLYGIRRLLLTGYERLSDRGRARLDARLAAGDPHDEVWYAHVVKEQLREVCRARDEHAARVALVEFYDAAQAAGVPECTQLARTIRRWGGRRAGVLHHQRTVERQDRSRQRPDEEGPTHRTRLPGTCATTGCGCCCTAAASQTRSTRREDY